jgi:hypothetical protein
MPLLKCPECGGDVSSFASACPHCGCPIDVIKKLSVSEPQKSVDGSSKKQTNGSFRFQDHSKEERRYWGFAKANLEPAIYQEFIKKADADPDRSTYDPAWWKRSRKRLERLLRLGAKVEFPSVKVREKKEPTRNNTFFYWSYIKHSASDVYHDFLAESKKDPDIKNHTPEWWAEALTSVKGILKDKNKVLTHFPNIFEDAKNKLAENGSTLKESPSDSKENADFLFDEAKNNVEEIVLTPPEIQEKTESEQSFENAAEAKTPEGFYLLNDEDGALRSDFQELDAKNKALFLEKLKGQLSPSHFEALKTTIEHEYDFYDGTWWENRFLKLSYKQERQDEHILKVVEDHKESADFQKNVEQTCKQIDSAANQHQQIPSHPETLKNGVLDAIVYLSNKIHYINGEKVDDGTYASLLKGDKDNSYYRIALDSLYSWFSNQALLKMEKARVQKKLSYCSLRPADFAMAKKIFAFYESELVLADIKKIEKAFGETIVVNAEDFKNAFVEKTPNDVASISTLPGINAYFQYATAQVGSRIEELNKYLLPQNNQ